jgi:small subunit ribosomal protein S4e
MKRLTTPKFWRIAKKASKWAVSPRPGPHRKMDSIPMQVVLRDVLHLVETGKEAQTILKHRQVLVDGRVVKDHAFPLGLMDVVAIPKIGKFYRMTTSKDGLRLIEIDGKEANKKLCKINGKRMLRGGKVQLSLHDGRNLLAGKSEAAYNTGDSLLLEMPGQKIVEHIALEKGTMILVFEGKDTGHVGKVKDIVVTKSKEPNKVIFEWGGVEDETIIDHVFVVGKTKPVVKIGEESE